MTTGKNMSEVLEAYNLAVEIRDLAQEINTYNASRDGLNEKARCRYQIEALAETLIRKLQQ